jgi:hypothetical protein
MKIVTESHLDHGLSASQIDYIRELFADSQGFSIQTFELPEELGTVPCGLHGPIMGDAPVPESEVTYRNRGTRENASRLCQRPARVTRKVTVIMGPHDGETVLYTAFGGPATPREPGDPTLPEKDRPESVAFWAEHALSEV